MHLPRIAAIYRFLLVARGYYGDRCQISRRCVKRLSRGKIDFVKDEKLPKATSGKIQRLATGISLLVIGIGVH